MAVKWHPDKQEQADEEAMAQADKMFKDIGEAYAVLSDPKKKQMYVPISLSPYVFTQYVNKHVQSCN